ncbi:hypothetical protein CC78DRAFT_88844 [Lojkania enalia]|uniref:Uncharacterized protein n=1 Tax=Lojkania enalia TaxID=147567 RepID=A0A9P4JYW0_9PLEO|nr:hypothetical protein CC78DRAFT_88844 [Didymosphaeria enalia]
MRGVIISTFLCILLPLTFSAPVAHSLGDTTLIQVENSNEFPLSAQLASLTCDEVTLESWEGAFHQALLCASRWIGEKTVELTLKRMRIAANTCKENSSALFSTQPRDSSTPTAAQLGKRQDNTNTNNNVNNNVNMSEEKEGGGGLTTEAKIGIGVGVPAAVFTLIGLFIMCYK